MKKIIRKLTLILSLLVSVAHADTSSIAIQGYDVVSYHQGNGIPVKGSGNNVFYYNDAAYLFSTTENKIAFEANPSKYAPAYGGYCAFGLTKGQKYVTDPLAYKVVDGTLYLNFSKNVQELWLQKQAEYITEANTIWADIKDKHPSEL